MFKIDKGIFECYYYKLDNIKSYLCDLCMILIIIKEFNGGTSFYGEGVPNVHLY